MNCLFLSDLEAKIAIYTHIDKAINDIKLGRTQDADDAFDDIISELKKLDCP